MYVTYQRVNILYPWIRVSICGNGASHSNATFSTVGSVLRVSDAPLVVTVGIRAEVTGSIPVACNLHLKLMQRPSRTCSTRERHTLHAPATCRAARIRCARNKSA